MEKKRIVSGVKPSGELTLGNYLGAIQNWVKMQDEYECFYFIADLHAITIMQEPKDLRKNTMEILAQYIASGLDPEKSTMFIQSHISAHTELGWILDTMSYMGELSRMTQFKEKSQKNETSLNAGLFTYPALMAADILLYQADCVPVGEDQKQHLELTRNLAQRFNQRYSDTFKVPEGFIPKHASRVMSLQDPTKKMSKSEDNINSFILLKDDPDAIRRKFKRAVTDSVGIVKLDDEQPAIKNLLTMYSVLSGESMESIVSKYEGKGYGDFKMDLGEVVIDTLRPMQLKFDDLMKNKDYLEDVYNKGAERANQIAYKTLSKVYKKVGLIPRKFV